MEWIEAKIYTTSQGVEVVSAMLMDIGINGIQIEDPLEMKNFLETSSQNWDYVDDELLKEGNNEVYVKFYVSQNQFGNELIISVKDSINRIKNIDTGLDLGILVLELADVDDKDWINNWKKYYKPFNIGKNIIIKPVWEEFPPQDGKIIFNINPGHVFGTGLHQTTQLCICQLEKYVDAKSMVLDLGCGSGILSIIALMLGAKNGFAVDLDPNAIDIAYENAALNDIGKDVYTVVSGNLLEDVKLKESISNKKYDIIVANIIADVIINISDFVSICLSPNGIFIASGIIKERVEPVKTALIEKGFNILEIEEKDDWYCIISKFDKK